ncbi:serine/threonine protein kinase [Streptomyces armeniacus]|uniref:Serine/threonine protein kinase n=1 Tax=Streptomyces armeniacus TaxID=83291 RepID=A0A345XIU9_9ACTN|nr:bifunctional serine/threonine-protein kinase/ABC transporter substrate-binding protein [Streptomyces armeniacus]AXK31565.1 serine/threonine protein kinase [Streptomyces armeniacus]
MSEPLLPHDPAWLGGHRLLARLGAGGMGVVYLGRSGSGALAAVKAVHPELAGEPDFRIRFRREVAAVRRVNSPWAVPVTAADPDAPTPWLATAYVPGPPLGEAVRRTGPLPVPSVRSLGRLLAAALREVHAAGLVHRDIKPGNVLLAVDGPRLIDFGIARSAGQTALTSVGMVAGTPGYLSPEQAEARTGELGPASDVFSLGCLLAYAATGRPPFGEGTVEALLYRTVHDQPDLEGIGSGPDDDAGAGLRALLRDCLAKEPAARPTAREIEFRLAEHAVPGGAWLPEQVVRDIADRSARMLALPDVATTAAGAPDDGPATGTGRRRLLALASGAAVLAAAGGGTALWAATRGNESGPAGTRWSLGVHADLSGPGKAVGEAHERGARLAVEQYNARRDKPFELGLKTADDRGAEARAKGAAQSLVRDRGVLAVLGPTTEESVYGASDTYDEALLPLLLVAPGAFVLMTRRCRPAVHCRPRVYAVGFGLAVYLAKEAESARPGVLQDRTADPVAWETTQALADTLRQARIPFRPRVVPAGHGDFGPQVADILDGKADAFVYAGHAEGAAKVARELAAAGFDGPRLGDEALLEPAFLEQAGEAAEGWLIGSSFVDPAGVPAAKAFTAAFRRRFGAAPGRYAAEAYDAANLAIEQLVKAAEGGRPPSRAELVPLLRKSRYRGITKTYAFDADNGRFNGETSFLYRVENGEFRYRGPAPEGS